MAAPPPEAYSRVTNPERFAPLHEIAAKLLNRLERDFDVERAEGYGLDLELEQRYHLARPTVSLLPHDPGAAPLVLAFSSFPGLHFRFGRWCMLAFPSCGCDACQESAEMEIDRLTSIVNDVTAGRFREAVRIRPDGDVWLESEFWSADERSTRQSFRLDPDRAQQLTAQRDRLSHDWNPWPKRA